MNNFVYKRISVLECKYPLSFFLNAVIVKQYGSTPVFIDNADMLSGEHSQILKEVGNVRGDLEAVRCA
jgi:hypothetical protein